MNEITYKEHSFKSGIYKIYWPQNGRFYFGQSRNLHGRKRMHVSDMRRGFHQNEILQNCFNKYGLPKFYCVVLCNPKLLNDVEQVFITIHAANKKCCNICLAPNNLVMAESTKLKISALKKNTTLSESHKNRISNGLLEAYKNGRPKPDLNGVNNPFFNKNHSQKSKDAMALSKSKMYLGAANPRARLLIDITTGVYYETIDEASEVFNINRRAFMYRHKKGVYNNIIFV